MKNIKQADVSDSVKLPDVYVGMKLFREMFNSRSHELEAIREYAVSKVGQKYFYLTGEKRYTIDKKTLKYTDKIYSQLNFQLYRTKEEIEEKNEKTELFDEIKKYFDWRKGLGGATLAQLRTIAGILGIKTKDGKD